MSNVLCLAHTLNPVAVHSYVDKAQIWLTEPLSDEQLAWLESKCGGKLHVRNKPMRFRPWYVERIQLRQPHWEALCFFAARVDAHLNIAEIALDWIFKSEDDAAEAFEFACRHHVKRHHRDQGVRFHPGKNGKTRYSGPRKAPNVLAMYADRPCRITGEAHCLHFDWRIKSVGALSNAGINTVGDLIALDHRAFWSDRLLMRDVDAAHFGRLVNNAAKGTKRKRPWIEEKRCRNSVFKYYFDERTGGTLKRIYSTQELIDKYRHMVRVHDCLRPIDVDHLLPHPDGVRHALPIVAAGFEYRPVHSVHGMPDCFSRPICELAMRLNDNASDTERQRLPYVTRLACADTPEVEAKRAAFIKSQNLTAWPFDRGLNVTAYPFDHGLKVLECALAIGRKADTLGVDTVKTRMEEVQSRSSRLASLADRPIWV